MILWILPSKLHRCWPFTGQPWPELRGNNRLVKSPSKDYVLLILQGLRQEARLAPWFFWALALPQWLQQ